MVLAVLLLFFRKGICFLNLGCFSSFSSIRAIAKLKNYLEDFWMIFPIFTGLISFHRHIYSNQFNEVIFSVMPNLFNVNASSNLNKSIIIHRHHHFQLIIQFILILFLLVCPLNGQQKFLTAADFRKALDEEPVTFLTELDFNNARKYKDLLEAYKIPVDVKARRKYSSILTQQRFFRGDIRGQAAWRRQRNQQRKLRRSSSRRRYNGVANVVKKWPNGRIPYVLSVEYTERERAVLARAFQEYQGRTCIRFVPKTPFDRDFLYIGKIDGCYSDVGRAGGKQELSLDDGCLHVDTVIHELMHSVGFYHEHERWDRDNYLVILWQNIDRDAFDQFGRVDLLESNYYGQTYDYNSIMHYDSLAFSRNGRETLLAKEPTMTAVIGSATDFSAIDLAKIHKMYQCFDSPELPPPPLPPSSLQSLEFTGDNSILGPPPPLPPPPPPQFGPDPSFPVLPMAAASFRFPLSSSSFSPSSVEGPLPRPPPPLPSPSLHFSPIVASGTTIHQQKEEDDKPAALASTIPLYLRVNSRVDEQQKTTLVMPNVEAENGKKVPQETVEKGCQDQLHICPIWLPYCESSGFYGRLMREICPRSCGFRNSRRKNVENEMSRRIEQRPHIFPVLVNVERRRRRKRK